MASGPPSSMRSTSLIFYQSPPVEPQIEDGDVVVTPAIANTSTVT